VLELSVRALDREVRATVERRVKALVAAQAESLGVSAQIDWKPGYAVLVNTPAETAFARGVAVELVGAERVTQQGPPLTGSEDFAFMLERVPGSYVLIGNGTGKGVGEGGCMVHNPGYDFNDRNIGVGSAYWVLLAERFLAVNAKGHTPSH
jgi:hippurate hydrolase